MVRTNLLSEIVKKVNEIHACFTVTPPTAKDATTVHGKCLVKMEKPLHVWMEDMNRNVFQLSATCCARKH